MFLLFFLYISVHPFFVCLRGFVIFFCGANDKTVNNRNGVSHDTTTQQEALWGPGEWLVPCTLEVVSFV